MFRDGVVCGMSQTWFTRIRGHSMFTEYYIHYIIISSNSTRDADLWCVYNTFWPSFRIQPCQLNHSAGYMKTVGIWTRHVRFIDMYIFYKYQVNHNGWLIVVVISPHSATSSYKMLVLLHFDQELNAFNKRFLKHTRDCSRCSRWVGDGRVPGCNKAWSRTDRAASTPPVEAAACC